jgi:hypothetical protein
MNGESVEEQKSREEFFYIIKILHSDIKPETSGERGYQCMTAKRREGFLPKFKEEEEPSYLVAVTLEL